MNMTGAKIEPALEGAAPGRRLRLAPGACGRARAAASPLLRADLVGVELVALRVLPDVLVPVLLRPAAALLARRHPAIMPGRSRRSGRL